MIDFVVQGITEMEEVEGLEKSWLVGRGVGGVRIIMVVYM